MTINDLCEESYKIACEKGWWDKPSHNIYEKLFLLHTEISEAGEELRNNRQMQEIYFTQTPQGPKPEGFCVEIADLLIRIGDTIGRYRLAPYLEEALRLKMEYNKKRPYRHGGKAC